MRYDRDFKNKMEIRNTYGRYLNAMLASQLDNSCIPSKTTNFLTPCGEDALEEETSFWTSRRKKFCERSSSCHGFNATVNKKAAMHDGTQKKPHPFRSPMTFLRSSTLPRGQKKHSSLDNADFCKRLTEMAVHNDNGWKLEHDLSILPTHFTNTTDDTPFSNVSSKPYYTRRQTVHGRPSKTSKNANESQMQFDGQFSFRKPFSKGSADNIAKECNDSLRRRASSLDFLPEAVSKMSPNGTLKSSPFARTTSMSQRSPFRRKIQFSDSETTITGIKEMRPKATKRLKSGIDCLFDAIERQDVEEVRKLLAIVDVDVNEVNPDQFTPLDIASMCGESEIATILLNHGGKENQQFNDPKKRICHLEALIEKADKNVNDYSATVVNSIGDAKENERHLREWEWRLCMLKVMQNGFFNTEPPCDAPSVTVAPLTKESVIVSLSASTNDVENRDLITKYKVEWSRSEDFEEIEGNECTTDKRPLNFTIVGLEKNIPWYVRVQSGNIKGFSPYGYPEPKAVIPSSWHECDSSLPRYYGVSDQLGMILDDLYQFQKHGFEKNSDDNSEEETPTSPQPLTRSPKQNKKRKAKRRGFSRYTSLIFNSAPKLLKKIKGRGIYLAALLYNDDLTKVLVTMDENLPVVECDENYSKSFSQEFYWFTKTSCTWKDIEHMLFFSTKSHSSQSVQIRRKLLQSALDLMNATGVTNLGPIHYKPFKDNHGSILLLAVNCIKKLPSSRAMTMKWMPIQKLLKKTNSLQEHMVAERLIPSVQDQVITHRRSRMHLPKGLYLGYLKLRTSMDTLSIMVPNSRTNVLPYVKIQDIPNVTKEEWEWLKSLNNEIANSCDDPPTSVQNFERRLKNAISKLFSQLGIESEKILSHRLYDHEVVEMNSEVLFIILCPPVEDICTAPNQIDGFSSFTAYSALPVQSFEMNNMMTYQPKLMACYCRLSSILELENYSTQQSVRETICHNESKYLKEKLAKILDFQQNVDELWKTSRWVVDTLHSCQDRNLNCGIPLTALYKTEDWESITSRLSITSMNGSLDDTCDFLEELTSSLSDDTSITNTPDYTNMLRVHGTSEIHLPEENYVDVSITESTTARDVINMAAEQFLELDAELDEETNNVLSDDNVEALSLFIVCGSRERCLRDDLVMTTLQNPWEKGTLYLRLKTEALRATKWGLSTAV